MVEYEWDWEMLDKGDGDPDIIDHCVVERPYPAPDLIEEAASMRLVLVRDAAGSRGSLERTWAYVRLDGALPERFSGSGGRPDTRVPLRFRRELARALRQ